LLKKLGHGFMTEKEEIQKIETRSIGSELIIPVMAFCFTIYYFVTIIDAPWTAQVAAFIVGAILIFLVVTFVVRSINSAVTEGEFLDFTNLVRPKPLLAKRIIVLGLTLAFILIVPHLGFTLTTFLFLSLAMMVLNEFRKKKFIILLSAALSVGGYLLFIVAFETRFPAGPFELFMKGLF